MSEIMLAIFHYNNSVVSYTIDDILHSIFGLEFAIDLLGPCQSIKESTESKLANKPVFTIHLGAFKLLSSLSEKAHVINNRKLDK